jgi:hypothetical protein
MRFLAFLGRVINELRARASALAVGLSLATVSLATGFISYTHISALTLDYWQNWKTAHLMPLAVDGQIVIGSVYFMEHSGERKRWLGLIGVVPGILESLYSNWQSVAPPPAAPWLAVVEAHLWATVPAQAFACSTILFERWLHSRKAAKAVAQPAAAPAPVTVPEAVPEAAPPAPEPAAPAAPAGAAPLSFPSPVPLLGPAMELAQRPAARPRRAAAARPAPAAAGVRPPLPEGEELAALLGDPEVSANEMSRRYDVSRWTANLMKKQYSEEMSDAAA